MLGLPQAVDTDTILSSRHVSGEQSTGYEQVVKEPMPLESQVLKRSPADNEGDGASDLGSPSLFDDSTMKMEEKKEVAEEQSKTPDVSLPKLNLQFPDARQAVADAEDNVRAKKSTLMQDSPYSHNPHTTTVCIQVRSEHQPKVVCGDPLSEAKKEGGQSMDSPAQARLAYRTPNDYYPHTYQSSMPYMAANLQPGYYRASPHDSPDIIPGRPSTASKVPFGPRKLPVLNQEPSTRPQAAARGSLPVSMYPIKRSEEEPGPKIGDATIPQGPGSNPIRVNSFPPPNSVLVHKQYYPAPYPLSNLIGPPSPSPLRLNCATEGGFIPYLRSSPPAGYFPIEERLIVNPVAARMAEVPQYIDDQQAYFMDPDAMVGSPYSPDGLSGTLFIDEDGQTYIMHDTQGRSAVSDQMMYVQDQFLGEGPKEDLAEKTRKQEEDLQRSKEELEELTKKIKDIKKKVAEDVEKKDFTKDMPELKKDSQSDSTMDSNEKKIAPSKTGKRSYRGI